MHGEKGKRDSLLMYPPYLGEVGWCYFPAAYALLPFELKVAEVL